MTFDILVLIYKKKLWGLQSYHIDFLSHCSGLSSLLLTSLSLITWNFEVWENSY